MQILFLADASWKNHDRRHARCLWVATRPEMSVLHARVRNHNAPFQGLSILKDRLEQYQGIDM